MCTVLLPPGVNQVAVNKYINNKIIIIIIIIIRYRQAICKEKRRRERTGTN